MQLREATHKLFLASLGAAAMVQDRISACMGKLVELGEEVELETRQRVRDRMEALATATTAAGFDAVAPDGGFYLWVDVGDRLDGATTVEWCTRLASERGVGLWPGEDFGVPGFVRLALPQGDRWPEAVRELGRRLTADAGRCSRRSSPARSP